MFTTACMLSCTWISHTQNKCTNTSVWCVQIRTQTNVYYCVYVEVRVDFTYPHECTNTPVCWVVRYINIEYRLFYRALLQKRPIAEYELCVCFTDTNECTNTSVNLFVCCTCVCLCIYLWVARVFHAHKYAHKHMFTTACMLSCTCISHTQNKCTNTCISHTQNKCTNTSVNTCMHVWGGCD